MYKIIENKPEPNQAMVLKNKCGPANIVTLMVAILLVFNVLLSSTAIALPPVGNPAIYTLDGHFDEGTVINVLHVPSDQLQLDDQVFPFDFIWVAASTRGTIVKIDTNSGAILGEYRSAPDGRGKNPSRTTVDNNGNVWVGNRAEFGFVGPGAISVGLPSIGRNMGSVVRIGLEENGQCVDRNNNGVIDTSTGLGDIKPWLNGLGVDDLGGVSTAQDECIINFTRVNATGTRHVSVDSNNDVWVSGTSVKTFDLLDGTTGMIVRQEPSVGFGGYGGLIDGAGVIWSARRLLRWDTLNPLTGPIGGNWDGYGHDSYGLCIDSMGNVWNTALSGNIIRKFDSTGLLIGTFGHGDNNAQGCVVDGNDHVWVAHSLFFGKNTVGHLKNNGDFIGNVTVGLGPTGVSVDANGKVWSANITGNNVSRIDPALGPIGADFVTPIGLVDLTVDLGLGAGPYNYSDMTGSTLTGAPNAGTWTFVHDSGVVAAEWGLISWSASELGDSIISVTVASGNDGVIFGPAQAVSGGVDLIVADNRYLKVQVSFMRSTNTDADNNGINDSPILFDLTIEAFLNEPPDCSMAVASITDIWPPNHKFVDVNVLGVTDPDGDLFTLNIDSIWQDEPVDTFGDGKFVPDGLGLNTNTASVRAERIGTKKVPGDGRVYHIGFTANDGNGASCSGEILTGVPHDQGPNGGPIDGGALFDSTLF